MLNNHHRDYLEAVSDHQFCLTLHLFSCLFLFNIFPFLSLNIKTSNFLLLTRVSIFCVYSVLFFSCNTNISNICFWLNILKGSWEESVQQNLSERLPQYTDLTASWPKSHKQITLIPLDICKYYFTSFAHLFLYIQLLAPALRKYSVHWKVDDYC